MTGTGPYGPVEMGGMFTTVKVRKNQKPGDYKDPGWYKQPAGTQAFEWTGALAEPARFQSEIAANNGLEPGLHDHMAHDKALPTQTVIPNVRKPNGHSGH
jgi:manganese oxidase